jgi:hypothetical protein
VTTGAPPANSRGQGNSNLISNFGREIFGGKGGNLKAILNSNVRSGIQDIIHLYTKTTGPGTTVGAVPAITVEPEI